MKTARSKQTLVLVAAALCLFGIFGAFFHQHAPTWPTQSAACDAADPHGAFGHSHFLPQPDDDADRCAICFFNRCASHGAPVAVHAQNVEFGSMPVISPSGAVPDSLLVRPDEARGPPAV